MSEELSNYTKSLPAFPKCHLVIRCSMAGKNLSRTFTKEDSIDCGSCLDLFNLLLLVNVEEKENSCGSAAACGNDA